jgi:FMN-dependent oxidoreductase (nitrilotriacetate monooxygenase family)
VSDGRIHFNGMKTFAPAHTAPGLWRHPLSQAHRYRELDFWVGQAQMLERGYFDSMFITDGLGVLDTYRGTPEAALSEGLQTPVGDPLLVISAMAAATTQLGFMVTVSCTYEHPYTLARKLTTLDHLTGGRIGWNVVTSALDSAARNLGLTDQLSHDERYERADEFMEVVYKLWEGSWEEDAVVADRVAGVYADPARVHPIGHDGTYFQVPGLFLCEPSAQRTPVICQAGASPAGRAFAARHAEEVFVSGQRPDIVRAVVDDIRARAAGFGRDPRSLTFVASMTVVTAPTAAQAHAKLDDYRAFASVEGNLARLSGTVLVDIGQLDLDQPLEYVETAGIQSIMRNFTTADPSRRWTPREIGEFMKVSGYGPLAVGSPSQVAGELERWAEEADLDGFNIPDVLPPATFADFTELVVPELQRRGRVWHDYEGGTLREYLGKPGEPRVADSHPAARYRPPGRGAREVSQ